MAKKSYTVLDKLDRQIRKCKTVQLNLPYFFYLQCKN